MSNLRPTTYSLLVITGQCAPLEGPAQRASVHRPDQDGGGRLGGRLSRCGQLAAQPLRWRPAWSALSWVLMVVRPDEGCLTLGARSSSHCRHGHGHSHPHRPAADSSGGRLAASRVAPSASFSASSRECGFRVSRRLGSQGGWPLASARCPARNSSAGGTMPAAGLVDGGTRRGGGRACGPDTCGPAHFGTSVSRMRRVAVSGSSVSL